MPWVNALERIPAEDVFIVAEAPDLWGVVPAESGTASARLVDNLLEIEFEVAFGEFGSDPVRAYIDVVENGGDPIPGRFRLRVVEATLPFTASITSAGARCHWNGSGQWATGVITGFTPGSAQVTEGVEPDTYESGQLDMTQVEFMIGPGGGD